MNYLALLQLIRRSYGDAEVERDICAALVACARKQGYADDAIHDALNSDRCLTIYEP